MKITKVLIADDIEKECVDLLQGNGIEVQFYIMMLDSGKQN